MSKIENNLLAFEAHLDELLLIIDNIELNIKLKSSLNSIVNWGMADSEQKRLISDLFKLKPLPSRVLLNSLYLSAVASFESFLSNLIEAVVETVNNSVKDLNSLGPNFINRQIELNGRILSSVFSSPAHLSIDYFKVCKNIGTFKQNGNGILLNTEIAGFIKKVIELDAVFSFLGDCNIEMNYDKMALQKEVKEVFESTKTRETSKALSEFLKDVVRMRNRIAHTGQSASDLSNDQIKALINKLKAVSRSINAIIISDPRFS